MKTNQFRKLLTLGLSLICIAYTSAVHAIPTVQFPTLKITGLAKYQGQFLSVYYVSAKPASTLSFNGAARMQVRSVMNKNRELLGLRITQDQMEIPAQAIPVNGFIRANAAEVIIHSEQNFDLMKAETQQGSLPGTSNEIELPLSDMEALQTNVVEVKF